MFTATKRLCHSYTPSPFSLTSGSVAISVPGLVVYPNFLGTDEKNKLQEKTLALSEKILGSLKNTPGDAQRTYVSKHHNLKEERRYRPVRIEENGTTLFGQHFEGYGSKDHRLTYFIGKHNLPKFVQDGLLLRIMLLPEIRTLSDKSPLDWNLTLNNYAESQVRPEKFGWHKDIDSNGDVTLIYNLGKRGDQLELGLPLGLSGEPPIRIQTVPLTDNSLVLMKGSARSLYPHRVVPGKSDETIQPQRQSLVLGCFNS